MQPQVRLGRLHLDAPTFGRLFHALGPSLGLWRAAEIAALREQTYRPPVLDLGCGDGLVTSMVLPRVEFGLDPDRGCLKRAITRRLYERFVPHPAERAAIRPGSLGTVVSNSVLEHIAAIDEVLEAVRRMLRPGGHFILTVPTEAFSTSLALPVARYRAWRNRQLNHLNLWTLEAWTERLDGAGFRVEEVRPYLRPGLVLAWDAMDVSQQVWVGPYRVVGALWKCLPARTIRRLAQRASRLDLSSEPPGGGRLLVAVRR